MASRAARLPADAAAADDDAAKRCSVLDNLPGLRTHISACFRRDFSSSVYTQTVQQTHSFVSGVTSNFAPSPCRKHHMVPAPATSFVKLCLTFLWRFCHLQILGDISSINIALFYLMDKD